VSASNSNSQWDSSYRLVASEKWKAKSAVMGRHVTQVLVEYASPQPGMNVLDLASGTGEPAISLAPLVQPGGNVTALDRGAELLKIAEERARQRGLTNFTTIQADANNLSFPDQTFDLITCRFGVMFLEERGLQEAYRVLKPGARACFVAWGRFEQPYWAATMGIVHRNVGGPLLPPGQDPFKYGQPGSLSAALRQAGFEAEEETRNVEWTWPGSAEDVWEQAQAVAAPFRVMLGRVLPEKWDAINREVLAAIRRYEDGGSIKFGAEVVMAAGTKR
jgi:SAM-dependent methyltransferase